MKKLLSILMAALMAFSVCSCALAEGSPFAGGTGTADDPWQIATAEQLLALSAAVNDGSVSGYPGQFFVLTADIDLKDVDWQPIGHMDLTDMSNYSCMFMGTLDGQGHTISNVNFHSDYPVCSVGVVGMNLGEVKNLTVQNVDIRCENTYSMAIGGVVGYNMGMIHDVALTGTNQIAGVNATGGIAGGSMQSVWNCTVDGTTIHVLGDNDFSSGRIIQADVGECGGLVVGGFFGGTIDNCSAKGTVIAEGNEPVGLGDIAGCLEMMDSMTNCTAEVEIISEKGGHAIGGLCGFCGTHPIGNVALSFLCFSAHIFLRQIFLSKRSSMRKKHCLIHLSACRLAPLPHKASVNTVLLRQLLCAICPVIRNICHFSGIVFTRRVK